MIKIRPRGSNFAAAGTRLAALGVTFAGYDHREGCYAGLVIPPGLEATLDAEPTIDVEWAAVPGALTTTRAWASAAPLDGAEIGARLRALRLDAGLDLATAAARSHGLLTEAALDAIERTGVCDAGQLIRLADLYGASIDKLAGRAIARGDRRR